MSVLRRCRGEVTCEIHLGLEITGVQRCRRVHSGLVISKCETNSVELRGLDRPRDLQALTPHPATPAFHSRNDNPDSAAIKLDNLPIIDYYVSPISEHSVKRSPAPGWCRVYMLTSAPAKRDQEVEVHVVPQDCPGHSRGSEMLLGGVVVRVQGLDPTKSCWVGRRASNYPSSALTNEEAIASRDS
jgi:hypothetical protein